MLLAIRKMHIKNTMRYYYTTIRICERLIMPSVGKDVEQLEVL